MSVIIETSIGDVTVDLYTDERPRCCLNFLKLCKIKYYNFSLFHTVEQNLMAQCGDPTATGRGGDSIFAKLYGSQARFFDMEVAPRIKHTKKGLVSMVNNGSGMHGSQFFITLGEDLDYLDGKHTVFGEVAEGMEVVEKLNNSFCGEDNRPHQDIRIYHTVILDDPFDDPENLIIPSMSPGPTEEMLNSDHIPCDANIDEDKELTAEQIAEMEEEKEAKANTQILEMVGDLPDADVAPPENVLFVCKLNPVTTSEDLEIIFSRFGTIVSCEVIKDHKTGESLQYAFVEFDNPQSCENAYFKMDNVLIDDRRIHVDFSQSVSKLKWKGKGKGVEIMTSGNAPNFILKNQQRQDNNYDLVYEDDVGAGGDRVNRTRKDKTTPRSNRSGSGDRHRKRNKSVSRSPSPTRKRQGDKEMDRSNQRKERDRERFRNDRGGDRSRIGDERSEKYDRKRERDEEDRRDRGRRERNRSMERNRRKGDRDRSRERVDSRRNERRREDERVEGRRNNRSRRSMSRSRSRSRGKDGEKSKRHGDRKNTQPHRRSRSESGDERGMKRKLSKTSKKQQSEEMSDASGDESYKGERKHKSKKLKRNKKKHSKRSNSDSSESNDTGDSADDRPQSNKKKNKSAVENRSKRRNDSSDSEMERDFVAKKSKKSHKRKRSRERSSS